MPKLSGSSNRTQGQIYFNYLKKSTKKNMTRSIDNITRILLVPLLSASIYDTLLSDTKNSVNISFKTLFKFKDQIKSKIHSNYCIKYNTDFESRQFNKYTYHIQNVLADIYKTEANILYEKNQKLLCDNIICEINKYNDIIGTKYETIPFENFNKSIEFKNFDDYLYYIFNNRENCFDYIQNFFKLNDKYNNDAIIEFGELLTKLKNVEICINTRSAHIGIRMLKKRSKYAYRCINRVDVLLKIISNRDTIFNMIINQLNIINTKYHYISIALHNEYISHDVFIKTKLMDARGYLYINSLNDISHVMKDILYHVNDNNYDDVYIKDLEYFWNATYNLYDEYRCYFTHNYDNVENLYNVIVSMHAEIKLKLFMKPIYRNFCRYINDISIKLIKLECINVTSDDINQSHNITYNIYKKATEEILKLEYNMRNYTEDTIYITWIETIFDFNITVRSMYDELQYKTNKIDEIVNTIKKDSGVKSELCSICQIDLYEGHPDGITTPCNHMFHATCLSKWCQMSYTCPICRTNI